MSRRKKTPAPPPGTFAPAVPTDAHDVLYLYAVAARAVCARPDKLDEVNARLTEVTRDLVPPESAANEECARLWHYFRRAATSPKPPLRQEAGKALYRDLESLGMRMDLAPLAHWDKLPMGLAGGTAAEEDEPSSPTDVTVESVRRRARRRLGKAGAKLPAPDVAELVRLLSRDQMEELFYHLVGEGFMGRAEGQMLIRWLAKGEALGEEDEALVEFLERLGEYLVRK
jgi:hypothetical protein